MPYASAISKMEIKRVGSRFGFVPALARNTPEAVGGVKKRLPTRMALN